MPKRILVYSESEVSVLTQPSNGKLMIDVEPDPWLGAILDRRALRVFPSARCDDGQERLESFGSECVFATAKVPASDVRLSAQLQDFGFRVVDTNLFFQCEKVAAVSDHRARFVRQEDRDAIVAIAGEAFVYSRFHMDPQIPIALADRVKTAWVDNYFRGERGDAMVTVEESGQVAGFLLLLRGSDGEIVIDLIAVTPTFARRGLGRSMIGFAAENGFGDSRMPISFTVGTQAGNVPSVRLYESLGFRLRSAQYVLHYHGSGTEEVWGARGAKT